MEITRFKHFLPFSENENRPGTFLTQRKLTGEADRGTIAKELKRLGKNATGRIRTRIY
jgi:hypothetical protein